MAVIGFPLANVEEIKQVCDTLGVEYTLLLNDKERWEFVESMSGQQLLNWLMELMSDMRLYDNVIVIGSDMRIRLAEAILGDMVIGLEIGKSPIKEDIYISPQKLTQVITTIRGVMP